MTDETIDKRKKTQTDLKSTRNGSNTKITERKTTHNTKHESNDHLGRKNSELPNHYIGLGDILGGCYLASIKRACHLRRGAHEP